MVKKARTHSARSDQADTCKQVTSLILDYVGGMLDRETALALERHLRICPDCVAFLATYRKTIQATRSLQYEDIPAEMAERIKQFLRRRARTSSPRS